LKNVARVLTPAWLVLHSLGRVEMVLSITIVRRKTDLKGSTQT
jgi:hypothetical protein